MAVTKALPPRATLAKYRARLERVNVLHPAQIRQLMGMTRAERKAAGITPQGIADGIVAWTRDLEHVLRDYERLLDQVDELPRERGGIAGAVMDGSYDNGMGV